MNNIAGHNWEVRHEDAPNLMDSLIVVRCVDCNLVLGHRRIPAFRKILFRDREAIEQFWAVHLAAVKAAAKIKVERYPDSDLLPY